MASVWGGPDMDFFIDFDDKEDDMWVCLAGHRFNYKKTGKYCAVQGCGYELKPPTTPQQVSGPSEALKVEKKTKLITKVVKRCPDNHKQPMVTGGRCSLCSKLGQDVKISYWVEVDYEEYNYMKEDEVWRPDPLNNLTVLREPGDPPRDLNVVNPFRVPLPTDEAIGWQVGPPGSRKIVRYLKSPE